MLDGEDDSNFVKVHDQKVIASKKRLYMTATRKFSAKLCGPKPIRFLLFSTT